MTRLLVAALVFGSTQGPARLTELSDDFEELSLRIQPAVVQILASGYAPGSGLVSSGELLSAQRSRGSGVMVTPSGYIVTNAHVVAGARRVRVLVPEVNPGTASVLRPGGELVGAQVVGVDVETDLALLKIQGAGLPYLELADSDSLRAGQLVLAFGSPLGLENSVTLGVVSSVARQLKPEDPMVYIQTDASINPGNSGGPLVDTEGRVVGINTFIFSQSGGNEGLGFAAPSNIVKNVFEQIRASGRVQRGEIGVRAQTITPLLARGLALPQSWGVILADVLPRGPGDRAGLRPGDIVLNVDGKPMENGRQLRVNIYQRRVGDRVNLEVLRGGETLTLTAEVDERRDHPNRFAGLVHPNENLVRELGILGIDLAGDLVEMFAGLRRSRGVIVAARAVEASPWEGEGLLPGDVIYAVNRTDIRSLTDLKNELASHRSGDPVVLLVERSGTLRYVPLELD